MATKEKWFHPETEDTGWHKDEPVGKRRVRILSAHKGDKVATGRSMVALANVTQDKETEKEARKDAEYFFRENAKCKRSRQTRRTAIRRKKWGRGGF